MPQGPGTGNQPVWPTVARSSPVPVPPRRRFDSEDASYSTDKSYRRYASGVQRALTLFDSNVDDWADYISFLGRLLKALQARPPDNPPLPHSPAIARRLAQCLNSSLPSGVHQRTLEVYQYMFATVGKEALARDLVLYIPGLSPLLSFASLQVRPQYLSLVEGYILELDFASLRPALKAIILSLLPALEDATSDDFERTLGILEQLKGGSEGLLEENNVGNGVSRSEYFWQCFFLACITSASRRQDSLAFLTRHLPSLGPRPGRIDNGEAVPEQKSILLSVTSPEPGLLVRCFIAGLGDRQPLVQRGFLDLLVTHLPLNSAILQQEVKSNDLEELVLAAVGVILRKDMSLNRRLWSWLLGSESTTSQDEGVGLASTSSSAKAAIADSSVHVAYLLRYVLYSLDRSISEKFKLSVTSPKEVIRMFRICLSLMDRWEIGANLIPKVFMPAMRSVQACQKTLSKEQFDEVLRSARMFFDAVESDLIWNQIFQLVNSATSFSSGKSSTRLEDLELASFIISQFNIREEDMLTLHIPLVSLAMLIRSEAYELKDESLTITIPDETAVIFRQATDLLQQLVQAIPSRPFVTSNTVPQKWLWILENPCLLREEMILLDIQEFYKKLSGAEEFASPLPAPVVGELLLAKSANLLCQALRGRTRDVCAHTFTHLTVNLLDKVGESRALRRVDLYSALHHALNVSNEANADQIDIDFLTLSSIATTIIALCAGRSQEAYMTPEKVNQLIPALITALWLYLSPSFPRFNLEAVRLIRRLHSIAETEHLVEASICEIVSKTHELKRVSSVDETFGRFTVIWALTIHGEVTSADRVRGSWTDPEKSKPPPSHDKDIGDFHQALARPLFILLDSLNGNDFETGLCVRSWLNSFPEVHTIIALIVCRLCSLESIPRKPGPSLLDQARLRDDAEQCAYLLETMCNVLHGASEHIWLALTSPRIVDLDSYYAKVSGEEARRRSGSLLSFLAHFCVSIITFVRVDARETPLDASDIWGSAVRLLKQILRCPHSALLRDDELELPLLETLRTALKTTNVYNQVPLLEVILLASKLCPQTVESHTDEINRTSEEEDVAPSRKSSSFDRSSAQLNASMFQQLLSQCLLEGFASDSIFPIIHEWIRFLSEVLPLFANLLLQNLIPLVDCFCTRIDQTFHDLKASFNANDALQPGPPESVVLKLLDGLEQILASAHERLVAEELKLAKEKSTQPQQGLFGNMRSGTPTSEIQRSRSAIINGRLSVLLSFQDAIRICYSVWSFEHKRAHSRDRVLVASHFHAFGQIRTRARQLIEQLFAAEAVECLETLAVKWCHSTSDSERAAVLDLLSILGGAQQRSVTIAIIHAIYSRTNPNTLEFTRRSTLTSDLTELELVMFLNEYLQTLEDDVMNEIWIDCVALVKDILGNPLPRRQVLPAILYLTTVLAGKIDNTNVGNQRRMTRELGDLFLRILTAVFTISPVTSTSEPPQHSSAPRMRVAAPGALEYTDIFSVLASVVPKLQLVFIETERVANAVNSISAGTLGPLLRAKGFPENFGSTALDLLFHLTKIAQASKAWKKDVSDAFNNPRFFSSSLEQVEGGWLPILRQWIQADNDRLQDLVSRISPPATAGVLFAVGANSTWLEADRKAQLNLRRIAVLILSATEDSISPHVKITEDKLVELMAATLSSSPSSLTRAEIFMVLRAMVLQVSQVHLASLWPMVNAELQRAILSVLPDDPEYDTFNTASVFQACKLLDLLLMVAPEDFQMYEWVFVTDSIDAVYRPPDWQPSALIDEVAEALGSSDLVNSPHPTLTALEYEQDEGTRPGKRSMLLKVDESVAALSKDELVRTVLRPFFSQLSILTFEATYNMGVPDLDACRRDLLRDLFDERTIAG